MTTNNVTCDNIASSTGYFVTKSNNFIVGLYGPSLGFSSNKVSYLLIEGAGSASKPMYIGPTTDSYSIYGDVTIYGNFSINCNYSGDQTISTNATFGIYAGSTRLGSTTITLTSGEGYKPSASNYSTIMNGKLSQYLGHFTSTITSGTQISLKYEYNSGFTTTMSGATITSGSGIASASAAWTGNSYVDISSVGRNNGTVFISPNAAAASIYGGTTYINVAAENTSGGYANRRHISMGAGGRELVYIQQPSTGWTTTSDKRDKTEFKEIEKSLSFINKLVPLTFVDNSRINYYDDNNNFDEVLYNTQCYKGHRRIAGFIAQDVYQTIKDVYDDDNYASIVDYSRYDDPDNEVDRYYMRYTQLIPFLTGAIQELSEKLDEANKRITELENKYGL